MLKHRRVVAKALAACALAALASVSMAQGARSTQARIVVGNQPGGATDIVARLLAPEFSKALGDTFLVENRTGASGIIAAEHVARSPADGKTILLIFNSHTTLAPLFPKLTFDPIKDFAAVGMVSESPYLVVARPNVGVANLADLVARAAQTKTPISAGSPGLGTPQHLLYEQMKKAHDVGVDTVHYKGSAPAQNDVMGGHVDITLVTPSLGGSLVKSGNLALLGVTSEKRLADFPDAPTSRELGIDSLNGSGVWLALLVPAGTPADTVTRLNQVLNDTLKAPEVQERLQAIGMTAVGGPPEALAKRLVDEQTTWTKLIQESKISIE